MNPVDGYLMSLDKKIKKLAGRLFSVLPEERARTINRIEKLKQRRKDLEIHEARERYANE